MPAQYYATNNQAIQDSFQEDKEESKRDSSWLKLKEGTHVLRICPPWSNAGQVFLKVVTFNNLKDSEDRNTSALCYDYIFKHPAIMRLLGTQKLISKVDYEKYKQHGDPFLIVANRAKDFLTEGEYKKAKGVWPSDKFVFNVVNRADAEPKVYKMSQSRKFYDAIITMATHCPDMFDPEIGFDFTFQATGEQLNRRYTAPMVIPKPKPLDLPDTVELFNLDKELSMSCKPWGEYVNLLIANRPQLLQRLGLDPALWLA